MLYSEKDVAIELAAQLPNLDLGVTDSRLHDAETSRDEAGDGTLIRLDNGQEFLLTVTRWGGPGVDV